MDALSIWGPIGLYQSTSFYKETEVKLAKLSTTPGFKSRAEPELPSLDSDSPGMGEKNLMVGPPKEMLVSMLQGRLGVVLAEARREADRS